MVVPPCSCPSRIRGHCYELRLDEIDKISISIQTILQAAEKKRDKLLQTPVAAYLHSKQEGF